MILIVGLGNPGNKYKDTPHNVGFRVLDEIAKDKKINFKTSFRFRAKLAQGNIAGQDALLFKSLRFMNLTGLSLAPLARAKNINLKDLLVVGDCLDLEFGKIRLKEKGSDAGHRGMRSIITSLSTQSFSRLKIGIGRPSSPHADISEYVLTKFSAAEEKKLSSIIDEAKLKIFDWIKNKEKGL